ncbi:DUF3638 domain-containing protein [Legionella clemsonensis]|uniref:DUF3638 domain-containing protein n=1 Tax=Legionella clemsonensis TaxID=1867846 RepID=A0A222P006_9GAMM|nr:DUF3638 domain-containing protein [Legionella clemsonensis]ASQ45170.1 hypothetical protein clem_03060 [Legionella clemsonensis]
MTRYAGEVATLFSHFDTKQLKTYIATLGISDVKILHAEVLPQIKNLSRRKQIKQFLTEHKKQIFAEGKQPILASELAKTATITEYLQKTYEHLTKEALFALKNNEIRQLVLARATDDELFILEQKLKSLKDEQLTAIQQAIDEANNKREFNSQKPAEWLKQHKNLQWDVSIWKKIIKNVHKANLAISNHSVLKSPEATPITKKNLLSQMLNGLKTTAKVAVTSVASLVKWTILSPFKGYAKAVGAVWKTITPKRGKDQRLGSWIALNAVTLIFSLPLGAVGSIVTIPAEYLRPVTKPLGKGLKQLYRKSRIPDKPYELKITEAENDRLKVFAQSGADEISAKTALTVIGEQTARTPEQIKSAIMTRFGMALASQVVSGTQTDQLSSIGSVIGSLVTLDDTNVEKNSILRAVRSVNPGGTSPFKVKDGDHAFGIGGEPEMVTSFERNLMGKLVDLPHAFEDYGLKFTKEERDQIATYHKNQKRSENLINIMQHVCEEWGGYEKIPGKDDYRKLGPAEFLKGQKKYQTKLDLAGKALQRGCLELKNGEALYLETGLEGHAMQLVIKREGNQFKLSTYDSSGALENTTNKGSLAGLLKLSRIGNSGMRKNALSFKVSEERLNSAEGLAYLTDLIHSKSYAGWAQTHIEENVRHTSMEERNQMGDSIMGRLRKAFALNDQAYVYQRYIERFSYLASEDAPPQFEELLQRPQNTGNCYAKKTQSNELYELGKSTYKKVRLAMLLEQRQALLSDICGDKKGEQAFVDAEYIPILKGLEPEYLSPAELHEASMRLTEINEPPSNQYYQNYFTSLIDLKEQLAKAPENNDKNLAIRRIEQKIANHAKELYFYLKSAGRDEEIQEYFIPEVYRDDSFSWEGNVFPFKEDDEGKLLFTALNRVSEHAAALAWKASLQILNHQIQKLSVNERHIHSPNQRLEHASYWRASGNVTLKDLENANIVSFVTGFSRNEDTKIEINIGRTRKEIDKATFFRLVIANKEALTNPKVMGLLDALRNSKPEIEKRYIKEVYPAQRQAFIEKLTTNIEKADLNINTTLSRLEQGQEKVKILMAQCQENIDHLNEEIFSEKTLIGEGNKSIKLQNLDARVQFLMQEMDELNALKISVSNKLLNLRGNNAEKTRAELILAKLKDNDPKLNTMNAVSRAFKEAMNELEEVRKQLISRVREFEEDDVEQQSNHRLQGLKVFREKIISNYLRANPDYRILDELAMGNIGTEKQKNRELYSQTPEKREEFYKQGKNTFLKGSVFQEIQSLNQQLKGKITGEIERRVLLSTDIYGPSSLDTMSSGNSIYASIEEQAKMITQKPISSTVKTEWMKGMFAIWLKHEDKEKLYNLQRKSDSEIAIKKVFQHFLHQKANIKVASLKETEFPVELSIQNLGWKTITEEEMVQYRKAQHKASLTIAERFKAVFSRKPKQTPEREPAPLPVQLTAIDLMATHAPSAGAKFNAPADIEFIPLYTDTVIDGSTLDFLRENPTPTLPTELTLEKCNEYYQAVSSYLEKLEGHQGLENKEQRITEFCHSVAANTLILPFPPGAKLVIDLSTSMLARYKDDNGNFDTLFMKLENSQRAQILTNLIKFNLTQLPNIPGSKTKVDAKFYSTIKHWERLTIPKDTTMSERIAQLEPGGSIPVDNSLIEAVDSSILYSPIGLEGILEGQTGQQIALTDYGKQKQDDQDEEFTGLRKLADRLGMRNGDKILAHQFIQFYDKKMLLSADGLNSTAGRELFIRAFVDAFVNATDSEKEKLLQHIELIQLDPEQANSCNLMVSHEIFLEEVLYRASILDPKAFKGAGESRQREAILSQSIAFIKEYTDPTQKDGLKRLFGFAKEINLITLQIESARAKGAPQTETDKLYAKLIYSNLAYQLMYDQTPEDTLLGIDKNFEIIREMALVQANINKEQHHIIQFSKDLKDPAKARIFEKEFKEYAEARKFNDMMVNLQGKPSSSPVPGFISLGGINSLDTLHGAIYIGANKLGYIPAHIQSNIALEILSIHRLPFKPKDGGYIYTEGKKIKASITPQEDGSLIIQRELKTIDGKDITLQYIPPEKIEEVLPISLRRRVNADHFFIDKDNAIHAFNADFTPVLKISKENEIWSGKLLDKNNMFISIVLNKELDLIKDLSKIFPSKEMIAVDKNTVYVPSIFKFIIKDETSPHYFIADSKTDHSSRKHFEVTKEGNAILQKVLSPAEAAEVAKLEKKIVSLTSDLAAITQSNLVSKQSKAKIKNSIKACVSRIREIKDAEIFLFVGDSPKIKELEERYAQLRTEMLGAYAAFKDGGKDREQVASKYDQTKAAFFKVQNELRRAYATTDYLRVYQIKEETLKAKDFHSILHIGLIEGKTQILIQMLSANVPTSPLKTVELEELYNLQAQYVNPTTTEEHLARVTLLGIEITHHLLERTAAATGKSSGWNRKAYMHAINAFKESVSAVQKAHESIPVQQFSELWRAIESEFVKDDEVIKFFSKPIKQLPEIIKQPLSINTKTNNMPIENFDGHTQIEFRIYENPLSLIDKEQMELATRLKKLEGFEESIQAQEDGYYYENFGLFNNKTLEHLFSITSKHLGIEGLTKANIEDLLTLMKEKQWIKNVADMEGKFQIAKHPIEFFSHPDVGAFLAEKGFDRGAIKTVSDRLETFLYQTAVNGGAYTFAAGHKEELRLKITDAQKHYNLEFLGAKNKIDSLLTQASDEITMADLHAAYLLNDYREILSNFPPEEHVKVQIALNNAMTRMLYYKTELDHLNDVQNTFEMGQDSKAISMLYIKRNYPLDKLLLSASKLDKNSTPEEVFKEEQEQKMQRAFLLFESEFNHRCNTRQVNVFRGLLLDEETNPDKIDSAQARMGFGKTTLLPLVALYKTGGDKLVRFIVPKSALETNTADMSVTLTNVIGKRAVKDDFQRYSIASDPKADMGLESSRLQSLQSAKEDLKKRLAIYKKIIANREVLVQSPSVRNSMECQAKIFLDMLLRISEKPTATEALQNKELIECISVLNEIRSITTISVFDELDATQDSATTEVNYTSGNKLPLDPKEIYPLEVITQTILAAKDKSPANLAKLLLDKFNVHGEDRASISNYILSLEEREPSSVTPTNSTLVYLMRAILTDPKGILTLFTEKEAGKDFGVWFQNGSDGKKKYDFEALRTATETQAKNPLLITVPYSSANQPKPQGSRFDNPEVTAITTFLYYLDPNTEICAVPHFEFLIESFRSGSGERPYLDPTEQHIEPEFADALEIIKKVAETPETVSRNEKREAYFTEIARMPAFRRMLARTIIQDQIKFDAGKANSNRYEQGTPQDVVIGFSGTAGDTSSHFKENMLDPAADGNMTLGIMARSENQGTHIVNSASLSEVDENYSAAMIAQFAEMFEDSTRALIDVGGLCKVSNREVAKEIALQLRKSINPKLNNLEGVIFYDDITNMKKVLILDAHSKETIKDLTPELVAKSDLEGKFFTYYDQSHSRGADIKQMDGAKAILTASLTLDNNDYKQAIMRMRKIIDRNLKQSFSIAVPDIVRNKILEDLKLPKTHTLTGNDIAFWLRQKELKNDLNKVAILTTELDAIVKNAILQQQANITNFMTGSNLTPEQINIFKDCISELNEISKFISGSSPNLQTKYGGCYGKIKKEVFIQDLDTRFKARMANIFTSVNKARIKLELNALSEKDKEPYFAMEREVIERRAAQISPEFTIPQEGNSLSEAQSETENQSHSQSESQSQSQTQTYAFSDVKNEEVVVEVRIKKPNITVEPASVDFLLTSEKTQTLSLASKTLHMTQLFKEEDSIRCSPSYKGKGAHLIPPIRYFLARESKSPQVIIINQAEANAFKNSVVEGWSLYDIRSDSAEGLLPIVGPKVKSLEGKLLNKLNFAAYRYQVEGGNVEELATALNGICTPTQLEPSLTIQYANAPNVSKETPIFELATWGFDGIDKQEIQVRIKPTNQTITDKKGITHQKTGVTISVQVPTKQTTKQPVEQQSAIGQTKKEPQLTSTNIFISSRLKERILAGNHSQLSLIAKETMDAYKKAMIKRKEIRKEIADVKAAKAALRQEYKGEIEYGPEKEADDQPIAIKGKIKDLEIKIARLVKEAKEQIAVQFPESAKDELNQRKKHQDMLNDQLRSMCSGTGDYEEDSGLRVDGILHDNLGEACIYLMQQLYKQHSVKRLTTQQISEKLDDYIDQVFEAVEERYEEFITPSGKGTLIDSLFQAAREPPTRKNDNGEDVPNTDIKIEGMDLNQFLRYHLYDLDIYDDFIYENEPERNAKKWKPFVEGIQREIILARKDKNLTPEAFLESMTSRVKRIALAVNDNEEISERRIPRIGEFISTVMQRLSISANSEEDEEENKAALKRNIRNVVTQRLLNATTNPSSEDRKEKNFFVILHGVMKSKLGKPDYELPPELLAYNKAPVKAADIKPAIIKALESQHMVVSTKEIDKMTQDAVNFLNGHKAAEKILDNYKAKSSRSKEIYIKGPDDERAKGIILHADFKILRDLDRKVLPLQNQLIKAREKYKKDLKALEEKHAEIRGRAKKNEEEVQKIKGEVSVLNKLINGAKNLLKICDNHHIKVAEKDALEFIDVHFDVPTIVEKNISADVDLLFTPPEYLQLEKDMKAQLDQLHGLDSGLEENCGSAFNKSVQSVVIPAAKVVQKRECKVDGLGLREKQEVNLEMASECELAEARQREEQTRNAENDETVQFEEKNLAQEKVNGKLQAPPTHSSVATLNTGTSDITKQIKEKMGRLRNENVETGKTITISK